MTAGLMKSISALWKAVLPMTALLQKSSKILVIQSKYHGDFIWQRAIKAIQALTDYVNMAGNNMNVVLVGHDTLFEVMLQKMGYYEKANCVLFVLWSDNCKFPNGNVFRINMDTFKDL